MKKILIPVSIIAILLCASWKLVSASYRSGRKTPGHDPTSCSLPDSHRSEERASRSRGGDAHHPEVNWISALSQPTLLPPYFAGSNKSNLMTSCSLPDSHRSEERASRSREKLYVSPVVSVSYLHQSDSCPSGWSRQSMERGCPSSGSKLDQRFVPAYRLIGCFTPS